MELIEFARSRRWGQSIKRFPRVIYVKESGEGEKVAYWERYTGRNKNVKSRLRDI